MAQTDTKQVVLYTDGACSGNPGPGGWAAILMFGERKKELSGYQAKTTNNRMELLAAIEGLRALNQPCAVALYSDSSYLVNGFVRRWVYAWRSKGWKRESNGKQTDVPNSDLWQQLIELSEKHDIRWNHVRGHADNAYNNRCDELARGEIVKNRSGSASTGAETGLSVRLIVEGDVLPCEALPDAQCAAPVATLEAANRGIAAASEYAEDAEGANDAPPQAFTAVAPICIQVSWDAETEGGGWCAALDGGEALSGNCEADNANVLELRAGIAALETLAPTEQAECYLSGLVLQAFQLGWIERWKEKGWTRGKNTELMHADLWARLQRLSALHGASWRRAEDAPGDLALCAKKNAQRQKERWVQGKVAAATVAAVAVAEVASTAAVTASKVAVEGSSSVAAGTLGAGSSGVAGVANSDLPNPG